ncbi:type VII secretion system-associated protein [Streptomyces nigra]|uniref:type VII secretion system-associated protein n=1 Tax=Streptomyces nigra TaxID=1827580 RepID=UPI00368C273B
MDPPPPEEYIKAAKAAPDHWLFLTDPAYQGEYPPPEWAVVGQWRSDSEGVIVEWETNEDYKPSPEAMGWPEPLDEVDRAIQLATTGYGPVEDVTEALARAELSVLVTADGEPVRAATTDGAAVVLAYTSSPFLHSLGPLRSEKLPIADLLDRIPPGHSLSLNSSAAVNMVLTADGLAEMLKETETETETDAVTPARDLNDPSAARIQTDSGPVPGTDEDNEEDEERLVLPPESSAAARRDVEVVELPTAPQQTADGVTTRESPGTDD